MMQEREEFFVFFTICINRVMPETERDHNERVKLF